jgi:elongation factor G
MGASMKTVPSLLEIAIEPKPSSDLKKLHGALSSLTAHDPSLHVATDQESGQIILGGSSESHLERAIDALRRADGVDVSFGAPQIAYRETLTRRVEVTYTHRRAVGPASQFAKVTLAFEPVEVGAGSSFESRIVAGSALDEYVPGVRNGVESVMGAGILAGFPIIDVKATLIDGAYDDVDSSIMAFEFAARSAFREALQKGGAVLLEPVMDVVAIAPREHWAFVKRDLLSRGALIRGQTARADAVVFTATAPLDKLFGYAVGLRNGAEGRAAFTMRFSHYAPLQVPRDDGPFPPAVGMRA